MIALRFSFLAAPGKHILLSMSVNLTILGTSYRRRQWQPPLVPGKSHGRRSLVGCSPWGREESDMTEQLHFHALEKEMATHSSVLAWRIPRTAEHDGLPSMGSHRVGHDWSDLAHTHTLMFRSYFVYLYVSGHWVVFTFWLLWTMLL